MVNMKFFSLVGRLNDFYWNLVAFDESIRLNLGVLCLAHIFNFLVYGLIGAKDL